MNPGDANSEALEWKLAHIFINIYKDFNPNLWGFRLISVQTFFLGGLKLPCLD